MQVEQWLIERMTPPVQNASTLQLQSWDDALAGKPFQRMCFPTVRQPPQPGTIHFIYSTITCMYITIVCMYFSTYVHTHLIH